MPTLQGIATLALESPFYGQRKPHYQQGSKLLHVSDLLLLGRATIEESLLLLHWLGQAAGHERLGGCVDGVSWAAVLLLLPLLLLPAYSLLLSLQLPTSLPAVHCALAIATSTAPCHPSAPAGVCGLSMGGVHANMVASLYPGPLALTPLLSPRSAAGAYCSGALYHATAWSQVGLKGIQLNAGSCGLRVMGAAVMLPAAGRALWGCITQAPATCR